LAPEFGDVDIDLAYNGIPACRINTDEKFAAKDKLRQYCENLLGYKPDFVFTHVTRLVKSKGLWRDLKVLEQMEQQFQKQNKTAVMFVLSTETCRRPTNDVLAMESKYHWPVAHREGWPDLSGGEAVFYAAVQEFNAKSKNIKVIFINQFGFNRDCCGHRMSEDIQFMDIRKGTDVEFGLSIYEPFGIAQLEPLSFGGICVVSNVCGCAGFVRDVTGGDSVKNVIIADYISLNGNQNSNGNHYEDIEDMLQIDNATSDQLESIVSQKLAQQICCNLPETREQMEEMLAGGYELARHMSWDVVVENYILKSFHKAILKQNTQDAYMRLNSPVIN
jgi:glycogen synthase